MKPMIDPDFSALIPPLSQDEYKQLEKNILKEGIRHNLVVWEGILLDGHNRLRIALKHGLTYGVDNITLKDRDAAQAWMVDNQLGRRNLTPAQRDYLLGLRYRQEKKSHGGVRHEIASGHTVHLKTAEQIGARHGVSGRTVQRAEKFADGLDNIARVRPEVKQAVLLGQSTLTRAEIQEFVDVALECEVEQRLLLRDKEEAVEKPKTQAPHVARSRGHNEWYTPKKYIDIARAVMGSIDTDPASSDFANKTVEARTHYTVETNGLEQDWHGNVWMNPPYSQPEIVQFSEKLIEQIDAGNVSQAMVLVNNATETAWFNTLASRATAIWFIRGRVRYLDETGKPANTPLQGQCILYYGKNIDKLIELSEGLVAYVARQ